ncbi:MAG: hypothetical protein ABI772_13340 [Bacteroidota bacterium]
MKKFLFAIFIIALSSCGPTAEEKAKIEQAQQDSLKAAQDMQKAAEDLAISQAQADSSKTDSSSYALDSIK